MAKQFTRRELELMNSMCAIALAAQWGEGDYVGEEWGVEDSGEIMYSLWRKISARLQAKRKTVAAGQANG